MPTLGVSYFVSCRLWGGPTTSAWVFLWGGIGRFECLEPTLQCCHNLSEPWQSFLLVNSFGIFMVKVEWIKTNVEWTPTTLIFNKISRHTVVRSELLHTKSVYNNEYCISSVSSGVDSEPTIYHLCWILFNSPCIDGFMIRRKKQHGMVIHDERILLRERNHHNDLASAELRFTC